MADRPYLQLFRSLDEAGVRYAVAGGLAVVLHGVPRMTFDLDIVVDDSDRNMAQLVGAPARTLSQDPFLSSPVTISHGFVQQAL